MCVCQLCKLDLKKALQWFYLPDNAVCVSDLTPGCALELDWHPNALVKYLSQWDLFQ